METQRNVLEITVRAEIYEVGQSMHQWTAINLYLLEYLWNNYCDVTSVSLFFSLSHFTNKNKLKMKILITIINIKLEEKENEK